MSNLEQKIRAAIIKQHKLQEELNGFMCKKQDLLEEIHNVDLAIKEINDQLGARMEQTEASRLFHEFCAKIHEEITSTDAVEKQEASPALEVETIPDQWPSQDGGVSKEKKDPFPKPKGNDIEFSDKEINLLKALHNEGKNNEQIARYLNRTQNSVMMQKRYLLQVGEIQSQKRMGIVKPLKTKLKKTPFSAYETGKLANYYNKEGMSIAEIAKQMGRTVKSVEKEFKNCKEAGLIK